MVKQRITLDMSMDDFDKVNKKNPSVLDISMNDLDQNKQTPSVLQGTTDAISDGFSFAPRPRFFADIENKGHRLMDNMTWKSGWVVIQAPSNSYVSTVKFYPGVYEAMYKHLTDYSEEKGKELFEYKEKLGFLLGTAVKEGDKFVWNVMVYKPIDNQSTEKSPGLVSVPLQEILDIKEDTEVKSLQLLTSVHTHPVGIGAVPTETDKSLFGQTSDYPYQTACILAYNEGIEYNGEPAGLELAFYDTRFPFPSSPLWTTKVKAKKPEFDFE